MNDEPSSSSTSHHHDDEQTPSRRSANDGARRSMADRRRKNRQMFNRKRIDLLDDLLRSLDILVYAELSTIYHMDCSFLRFLFRAMVQFMFLTPKPALFPEPPKDRPYIATLLGSNLICFLFHAWLSAPSAGEETRGYLHGGLALDFIGQKAPISKAHLLLLDLLVVVLQLVNMAAKQLRKRLKDGSKESSSANRTQDSQPTRTGQDLDAEERGVRRSIEQQDIEMQALNTHGEQVARDHSRTDESADPESVLATTAPKSDTHIFDALHSGQMVIADLDIWRSCKEQFSLSRSAAREPVLESQTIRTELLGRLLGLRVTNAALRRNVQA